MHLNAKGHLITALIMGAVLCAPAPATIHHVPGQYTTIQYAIDDCNDGDTVIIAPGTYTGEGNRGIRFRDKAITLRSADPNDPDIVAGTVIDCRDEIQGLQYSGIDLDSNYKRQVLAGVTIVNAAYAVSCRGMGKITQCIITECIARRGAAINCRGDSRGVVAGSPTIANCLIYNNYAEDMGGAIYCGPGSQPNISNCVIYGNSSEFGGAISAYGASPTISSCTIVDNIAISKGGGVDTIEGNLRLAHCILWNNTAEYGPQISLRHGNSPATAHCEFNDIQGGKGSAFVDYLCILQWNTGNIDREPKFTNPLAGNYHLSDISPCINAGDSTYVPQEGIRDFDGEPRVMGLHIDMGADESPLLRAFPVLGHSKDIIAFAAHKDTPGKVSTSLHIRNTGADILTWSATEDCPWLEISPSFGYSTGDINEIELRADTTELLPGLYTTAITINGGEALFSPATIPVELFISDGVLRVPQEYATIQHAIDDATEGDTVIIAPGTYTGHGNRDIDFLGKAITVRSTDPNDPNVIAATIIDCNGNGEDTHRAFNFHRGETSDSILSGLTITGGYLYAENGAGIYCESSHPTISACVISGNEAYSACNIVGCFGGIGGGIFLADSNAVIEDCTISENYAGGGGIYSEYGSPCIMNSTITRNDLSGIALKGGYPRVTGCLIHFNSGYRGAGINCWAEAGGIWAEISDCQITCNFATHYGGGIYVRNRDDAIVSVENCAITDNRAGDHSGGVYAGGGTTCMQILGCDISGNVAADGSGGMTCGAAARIHGCRLSSNRSGADGGGLYTWSKPTISNCLITGNVSSGNGGGICCALLHNNSPCIISNCTITGNRTIGNGHNAYFYCQGGHASVTHCIIRTAGVPDVHDSASSEICSDHADCVEQLGFSYTLTNEDWPGRGNINSDPCFVDPGYWDPNGTSGDANDDFWVDGDYHLKSQAGRWDPGSESWVRDEVTSACIDAGDLGSPIGREAFPNGGIVNMGAYGGTVEASKSYFNGPVCETIVAGDINGDCVVDFRDLAFITLHWLEGTVGD